MLGACRRTLGRRRRTSWHGAWGHNAPPSEVWLGMDAAVRLAALGTLGWLHPGRLAHPGLVPPPHAPPQVAGTASGAASGAGAAAGAGGQSAGAAGPGACRWRPRCPPPCARVAHRVHRCGQADGRNDHQGSFLGSPAAPAKRQCGFEHHALVVRASVLFNASAARARRRTGQGSSGGCCSPPSGPWRPRWRRCNSCSRASRSRRGEPQPGKRASLAVVLFARSRMLSCNAW